MKGCFAEKVFRSLFHSPKRPQWPKLSQSVARSQKLPCCHPCGYRFQRTWVMLHCLLRPSTKRWIGNGTARHEPVFMGGAGTYRWRICLLSHCIVPENIIFLRLTIFNLILVIQEENGKKKKKALQESSATHLPHSAQKQLTFCPMIRKE